jgi:hypothetical protein
MLAKKTIHVLRVRVVVTQHDIDGGECGLPGKCMEKIAIERALRNLDPKGGDHRTRVDAGVVKFNLHGYYYEAKTPKIAKRALIQFDKEMLARKRAQAAGEKFISKVQPHRYTIEAEMGRAIVPMTLERQKKVNAARKKRILEGRPDKKIYTLRQRVIGFGSV